jgi:hypothetical protein
MNCSEAKLKLEPCASGTLPAEEKIALEEHLATCEGCRLELELTRAVLGSPAFDGVDVPSPASGGFETTPATSAAPPDGDTGTPESGSGAETDAEVSFADLSLDDASSKAAAEAGAVPATSADKGPSGSTADGTPKAGSDASPSDNLWDFEPVDAQRDVGPPEGSLSFANEALTRKREDDLKRKATLVRLALWGGGISGGILLLGVSVWIALAFRQGDSAKRPPDTTGAPAPDVPPAPDAVAPAMPNPAPTTSDSSGLVAVTQGVAPAVPPAAEPGQVVTSSPSPAPSPGGGAGDRATPAVPVTGDPQRPATTKPKPKAPTKAATKPAPKPAPQESHAGTGSDAIPEWSPSDLQPPPTTVRVPDKPQTGVSPQPSPGPETTPPPPANPQVVQPAEPAGAPPAAVTPPPSNPAPPAQGAETAAPPPSPRVTKPIDRLYLATETAAKNEDLVTLRKLKDSWKSLLQNVAGPDRSRAKRGHADCLWAVQELSGRLNDRKEALAAYRDYVLTAPAGGTDSRSISRMHYLEEILEESK